MREFIANRSIRCRRLARKCNSSRRALALLAALLVCAPANVSSSVASFARNAALCAAATGCAAACCLEVVTTGNECLVERLGKYHRNLGPGLHLVVRPFETVSFRATTREQVMDVPPQQCYTLDNAPIKADAVLFLRIFDPHMARYKVDDLGVAILNLCLTQLREAVGKLTLDESFSSRDRINKALLAEMNAVCGGWGVMITRVELQNLEPSRDILAAMELQMAAERKKRAAILKSEGERITLVNEAEGRAKAVLADAEARRESIVKLAEAEKHRMRVEADGMAEAVQRIAGAISASSRQGKRGGSKHENGNVSPDGDDMDKALQLIMLTRYMETQAKFASSDGTKVLMFPTKDCVPLSYEGLQSLLR